MTLTVSAGVTKRSATRKSKPAGHLVGFARVSTAEQDPALDSLSPGDTFVVWRLDRSLPHLIDTVTAPAERGVGFRSVTEAVDTTTAGTTVVNACPGRLVSISEAARRYRGR